MVTTGTASNDLPNTDNDDQRTPPQVNMHWSRSSANNSKDGSPHRPGKTGKRKNRGRKGRRTFSLSEFRKSNSEGSKLQKKAWRKLSKPYLRMQESVKRMYSMQDRKSIHALLQDEVKRIESDAAILKDPAYRLSYVLHCLLNYGSAVKKVKTIKGYKPLNIDDFTITPRDVISAITEAFKDLPSPYKLSISDYTVKVSVKGSDGDFAYFPGLTPHLHRKFVGTLKSSSILSLRAKQVVDATIDDDYKQYVEKVENPAENLTAAKARLKTLCDQYEKSPKRNPSLLNTKDNAKYLMGVHDLHEAQHQAAAEGKASEYLLNKIERVSQALLSKLSEEVQKAVPLEQFRETKLEATFNELKKEVPPTQVIEMRNGNGITLQWHITHMSQWKKFHKTVADTNHKGARYLLGPSNMVQIPNNVNSGNSSDKEGFRYLTGDTVAYQLIKSSHIKDWTPAHRNSNTELYVMTQTAMDISKPDSACRVIGLYTHPDVVRNNDHEAPALAKLKANIPKLVKAKKGKKGKKGKRQGPNTRRNQKENAWKQAKRASEETKVTKEELAKHAPKKDDANVPLMEDGALNDLLDSPSLKVTKCPYNTRTPKKDLEDYCRDQAIEVQPKMTRPQLLVVVKAHFGRKKPVNSMKKDRKAKRGKPSPPANRKSSSD